MANLYKKGYRSPEIKNDRPEEMIIFIKHVTGEGPGIIEEYFSIKGYRT